MVAKVFTSTFAENGNKTPIPNAPTPDGFVSYDQGFGPDYQRQLGVDPLAKNIERVDFNQVMNDVTTSLQEMQGGVGIPPYSLALANALPSGGYDKGALIPRTDNNGFWISTAAVNIVDPIVVGASWLPALVQGAFTQTLTNVNVTLSNMNASYPQLVLNGALTGNVNLILPAWIYTWQVINNCTGAFTVTVKTAAGTGVVVPNSTSARLVGDGTNILNGLAVQTSPSDATPGKLLTVGAFGLGGAAIAIGEAAINTADLPTGFYMVTVAAAGIAPVQTNGFMTYIDSPTTNFAYRSYTTITGVEYIQTKNAGTWGAWSTTVTKDSDVGSANIPSGTTAQRSAAGVGKFRFNITTGRAEINNGTTWGSLGGATGGGNDDVFYENSNTVTADYTISAGKNAGTFGPININTGVTVTVPTGLVWTVV